MGRWDAVTKNKKFQWVPFEPSDSLTELMQLRDAEVVYITLQVRNLVLMHGAPVPCDYHHIGRLCGMTPVRARKVIHRAVDNPLGSDLFFPADGMISSKKAEEILEKCQKFRKKQQEKQPLSVDSRNTNKENQRLKNWLAKSGYLPIPYHTIPTSISNIKPIPVITSAARAGPEACRQVGDVLAGMTQAIGAVCLSLRDLNAWHLREMVLRYPNRSREEIVQLFNDWVAEKGIQPDKPLALFTDWLQKSTWLATTARGNA